MARVLIIRIHLWAIRNHWSTFHIGEVLERMSLTAHSVKLINCMTYANIPKLYLKYVKTKWDYFWASVIIWSPGWAPTMNIFGGLSQSIKAFKIIVSCLQHVGIFLHFEMSRRLWWCHEENAVLVVERNPCGLRLFSGSFEIPGELYYYRVSGCWLAPKWREQQDIISAFYESCEHWRPLVTLVVTQLSVRTRTAPGATGR